MAAWDAPAIFATGDTLSVSSANTWSNDLTFLYEAPYAYAYLSASVAASVNTPTQVPLDAMAFSGYGLTVGASVVSVPLTGVYQVNFGAQIPSASGTVACYLYQNGALATRGGSAINPYGQIIGRSIVTANASDTLGLWYFTDAAAHIAPGAPYTYLSASFVGSQ